MMNIRKKVRSQLDMTNGRKQLDIHRGLAVVESHSYHLLIGLGGMGVDALTEAKRLIQQTCEDSEKYVRYLGFDTSEADLHNAVSGVASGSVGLDENTEQCLLGREVLPSEKDFDWIDERVIPLVGDAAAGGVRQVGRLILTNPDNFGKVKAMITGALIDLSQNVSGERRQINVYILTGISGGTGGGMFIDMAYLVRQILNEYQLLDTADIFGYLFMPDVNTGYLPHQSKAILERNAYAALQELDYNMSLQDLSERYTIRWGNTVVEPGSTPEHIFNYVHLVSATDAAGHLLPNPRQGAFETVAQNILSFVVDEGCRAYADFGMFSEPVFSMRSHYSDNECMLMNHWLTNQIPLHCCNRYLAIGSYNFTLPIDDIMMYTASMFFEKMDSMFHTDPADEEYQQVERDIGIQYDQILACYRGSIPFLCLNPAPDIEIPEEDYEQRGREIIIAASQKSGLLTEIEKVERYLVDRIKNDFDVRIKSVYLDEKKGPIYAYHMITKKAKGLIDRIIALYDALPVGEHMEDTLYAEQIKVYREARKHLIGIFHREERIADFNTTGGKLLECFDFYALAPSIRRVYEEVLAYIKEQNARIFELSVKLLVELKEVFAVNARILTAEDKTVIGNDRQLFRWEKITIPRIESLLRNRFDGICFRNDNLIRDFERCLWEEAADRMGDEDKYDPEAFISRFIDERFYGMADLTIEEAAEKLRVSGQTREDVWEELFRKMCGESEPLFYAKEKNKLGERFTVISIPENCPELYRYIAAKARARGACITVQKTMVCDRICAQTVQSGITLSNSQLVENAEKSYALLRRTPGTHLIAPVGKRVPGDCVTWMEMSTLTPGYLRADIDYLDPAIRKLVEEERARKEEIKCLCNVTDKEIVSRIPALDFRSDGCIWEMLLKLTDVKTERIKANGDRPCLKISIGDKSEVFLPGTKGVVERLSRILNEGFSQFAICTPPVYGKEEVIAYRQPATLNPEDTLDYLTEQYITALVNRRKFLNEMSKYDVIYGFLNDVKAYQDEDNKRGYRVEMFLKLLLMERIFADGGTETRGEPAVIANERKETKTGFGLLLPRGKYSYEKQYYLYDYYYACCDDRDLPYDLCVTPVQRERRRVAFTKAAGRAQDEFEETLTDQTRTRELLDKVIAMKEETAGILARSEIVDALNGIDGRVSFEMADFFSKLYVIEEGLEMHLMTILGIADKTPGESENPGTDVSFTNFE